jgi:peptidoglycan/LPS O-acetylase OafA/YrhL
MPPASQASPVTASGSLLLDLARLGAALAVVFGHFSQPEYSTVWHYHLDYALNGVGVFFVLSGFVIRLITTARATDARSYALDRVSRIYSVLLPCLLFTLLASAILRHLTPALLPQILANLTFTAQCWGLDIFLHDNGVLWSLCYECFFYLFYGIAFFGRGWHRIAALLVTALVVGPPILIMLPLWLLGCLIHDLYQKLRPRPLAGILRTAAPVLLLAAAAFAARHALRTLAHAVQPLVRPLFDFTRSHDIHLLQRASPRFYLFGIPTAIALLILLLAVEKIRIDRNHPAVRTIRFAANGTFALYLLHVPLILLAAAFIPYSHANPLQALAVLSAIVVLGIAAQPPMDRLKNRMRGRTR